jgi:hypothetical protein
VGSAPLTITANFVLGKTGDPNQVALVAPSKVQRKNNKKAVADARLYGGIETAPVTASNRLADPEGSP